MFVIKEALSAWALAGSQTLSDRFRPPKIRPCLVTGARRARLTAFGSPGLSWGIGRSRGQSTTFGHSCNIAPQPVGIVTLRATGTFLPMTSRDSRYGLLPLIPLDMAYDDPGEPDRTSGSHHEGDSGPRRGSAR